MNENQNSTNQDETKTVNEQPAVNQQQEASEMEQSGADQAANQQSFNLDGVFGKRLLATFIDMVIIGVGAAVVSLIAAFILPRSPLNFAAIFNLFVFTAAAAAMLLKDMPYEFAGLDGQSPGKKAMGIRVTDLNKKPLTMEQSIKRNLIPASGYMIAVISSLLNAIPIGFIAGLAGFFIVLPLLAISFLANMFEIYKMYASPMNRRWGDTLANTIVTID